jgi:phage baseplate assembly protein W
MPEFDFKDHYIGYEGHPRWVVNKIIEDDVVRVVVQKLEMILFTNQGEVLGYPDLGCNLENLLFETRVAKSGVIEIIREQIDKYIPELTKTNYQLNVEFSDDPENFQEVMEVFFELSSYRIYFAVF